MKAFDRETEENSSRLQNKDFFNTLAVIAANFSHNVPRIFIKIFDVEYLSDNEFWADIT